MPILDTPPILSVVVPLRDEMEVVEELHRRLSASLDELAISSEILLVDDGSTDATSSILDDLRRRDPRLAVLTLSRNFGHQAAVTAGLDHARGDAVVVMDGDLQDPPELIADMLALWKEGHEVVYAVRRRRSENIFKRFAYSAFYRLLGSVAELPIPADSGDFGLMDRKVVDALARMPERKRFVRGLRAYAGFKQVGIPYDRPARPAGRSKYKLADLLRLATDGLVGFSGDPLRLVTRIGVLVAVTAAAMTAWVIADALGHQTAPRGWASLVVVVLFMGSIQLLSLGIMGEYVRRIFDEVKARPTYVVGRFEPAGMVSQAAEPQRRRARA